MALREDEKCHELNNSNYLCNKLSLTTNSAPHKFLIYKVYHSQQRKEAFRRSEHSNIE